MGKGLFTQGAAVLLRNCASIEELANILSSFDIAGRAKPAEHWAMGGQGVYLRVPDTSRGVALVDLQPRPWPDHMGSAADEPMLFGAWSMGYFGPGTYPGGLERAVQQAWHWRDGAADAVQSHRAFVRVLISHSFGASDDMPVLPADYDALAELSFVKDLLQALLGLPDALAAFHPVGELLQSAEQLAVPLQRPALEGWSNLRMFNIDEQWTLMDTVGSSQHDRTDVEAVFHTDDVGPPEVAGFVRAVAGYLAESGEVIGDGHTLDGPGGTWQAAHIDESMATPPRSTLRLFLQARPPA